tara:strand:- start:1584 stop:4250 length:2667 start_codon:yes stop_codon:yes gene_type:complete
MADERASEAARAELSSWFQKLFRFSPRRGQLDTAPIIMEMFRTNKTGVIEGDTGSGKSPLGLCAMSMAMGGALKVKQQTAEQKAVTSTAAPATGAEEASVEPASKKKRVEPAAHAALPESPRSGMYVCSSIGLQTQIADDAARSESLRGSSFMLMGARNYYCDSQVSALLESLQKTGKVGDIQLDEETASFISTHFRREQRIHKPARTCISHEVWRTSRYKFWKVCAQQHGLEDDLTERVWSRVEGGKEKCKCLLHLAEKFEKQDPSAAANVCWARAIEKCACPYVVARQVHGNSAKLLIINMALFCTYLSQGERGVNPRVQMKYRSAYVVVDEAHLLAEAATSIYDAIIEEAEICGASAHAMSTRSVGRATQSWIAHCPRDGVLAPLAHRIDLSGWPQVEECLSVAPGEAQRQAGAILGQTAAEVEACLASMAEVVSVAGSSDFSLVDRWLEEELTMGQLVERIQEHAASHGDSPLAGFDAACAPTHDRNEFINHVYDVMRNNLPPMPDETSEGAKSLHRDLHRLATKGTSETAPARAFLRELSSVRRVLQSMRQARVASDAALWRRDQAHATNPREMKAPFLVPILDRDGVRYDITDHSKAVQLKRFVIDSLRFKPLLMSATIRTLSGASLSFQRFLERHGVSDAITATMESPSAFRENRHFAFHDMKVKFDFSRMRDPSYLQLYRAEIQAAIDRVNRIAPSARPLTLVAGPNTRELNAHREALQRRNPSQRHLTFEQFLNSDHPSPTGAGRRTVIYGSNSLITGFNQPGMVAAIVVIKEFQKPHTSCDRYQVDFLNARAWHQPASISTQGVLADYKTRRFTHTLQAFGRPVRTDTDRGVIVMLCSKNDRLEQRLVEARMGGTVHRLSELTSWPHEHREPAAVAVA